MAGEWQILTVDQIKASEGRAIAIGPFGSRMKSDTYVATGVPVIRGNNISDTRDFVDEFVFVSDETADDLRSCNVFVGDLVFPHRGAIGQVGIISVGDFPRYILSTSLMKLTCDRKLVDPLFIFYFFRSSLGRHALLQHASTVGTPGIGQPLASLRSIRVPVPPLMEQRAIAHILGTLDDKIELNRRMSETLEAMARAIFKSWFVDFDPVRAKAEGRDPGLPKHIADLFPDSFEDSELGEFPKGSALGKISDLCDAVFSGGTPNTQNAAYWNGDVRWLSSGETREKFVIDTEKRITPEGVANSSTRAARAFSTVIASAGQGNTRGQTSLLCIDSYINQSVVVLHANCRTSSPYHLFFDLERRYEEFRRISDGHSSRGSLTTKLLAGLDAIVPPLQLIEHFDQIVTLLVERIILNLHESKGLAALRDALLPRLISGELRVGAAEKMDAVV